jgi:bifunctional non-homologous end joining protein LigD
MNGKCFYQKEKPKSMPLNTPTKRIRHAGGSSDSTNYVVGGSLETQLALVNLGCIAVHVMAGRSSAPRKSDWICFDLDPATGKFADAARAALQVKESLDALKLDSYAKTSGSRGIHVFVPLRSGPDADQVLEFARAFVARVAAANPKELTVEHSIQARGERVYLDPFRNGFGQTVVAPYSVRRREKAPFSTPLAWSEVKPSLDSATFNLGNFRKRLKARDPWADFFRNRQSLKDAAKSLKKL